MKISSKEEAFEIIELMSSDFNTMSNAFKLIAEVCRNSTDTLSVDDNIDSFEILLH